VHEDVGRFQVAVDDALLMSEMDRPGQGFDQAHGGRQRLRVAARSLGQAAAVHVFERDVGVAVGFADVVDLDDVGVVEPGNRLSLPAKTGQVVGTGVGAGENHLECYEAVESLLACLVDDAHAAPAE
jgi:hypothetical protein